jgi:hypothetical protein
VLKLLGMAMSVAWLVVVGASYAALFLFPAPSNGWTRAPTPPDLSRVGFLLLAAILILGIIRQSSGAWHQASAASDE